MIIVDKQGVTGKKVEYKSIPYKSISRFSVETSGHFDLDAELKIWSLLQLSLQKCYNSRVTTASLKSSQALASAVFK